MTSKAIANNPSELSTRSGWRSHRPTEDPEKTKRWGFVTAKPSEYLVHVRNGRILASSGQGASCFKYPWDAVAIVPTSLQRLRFSADQVTREKVGVDIVGLAVFRIAEPAIAFRVLNFSYPERAQQKLEETLTGMFIGATRRLVANLSVEECLTKRKSALAEELLREVAPVVGGAGKPADATDQGWGVVIDTIEIQEVRVLSESVFSSMQAPYRATLEQAAEEARALADQRIKERNAECKKESMLAIARTEQLIQEAHQDSEASLSARAREHEKATKDADAQEALRVLERLRAQHQADIDTLQLTLEAARARGATEALAQELSTQRRRVEISVQREEGLVSAEIEEAKGQVELMRSEAKSRILVAENLPDLAQAIGQRVEHVRITQLPSEAPALTPFIQTLDSLIGLTKKRSD